MWDYVANGILAVRFVSIKDQLADILLSQWEDQAFCSRVGMAR